MLDLYKILGVAEDATQAEIKAAYRKQAFALHPDTNPGNAGRVAQARFHELQDAYSVLRDEAKRAQYDRMRAAGLGAADWDDAAAGGYSGATPWGQPSVDAKDFDAAFDAWWKKMNEEFQDYEERQYAKERSSAERMARAAAWEWEKKEAQATKVRAQKLKWRTEDARLQRHAATLRRFWQTHSGFTLGDGLVAAAFLAGAAGVALMWRSHLQGARHQDQPQGMQRAQQPQPQPPPQTTPLRQQQQQHGTPLGMSAAAAAAMAAAAETPS